MRSPFPSGTALLGLCLLISPAHAFQVTLDSDVDTLTIVDGDVNDLNASRDEIDFSQTVGGVLFADGRVTQSFYPIARLVRIGTRTPGSDGVFKNLDGTSHTFAVTVDTDAFSAPGPALGWTISSSGLADDTTTPTQSALEIPMNDVELSVDSGSLLLGTLSVPITPAVAPRNQPVSFDEVLRGVAPTGDATQMRVTWVLSPGPNDEIRLPDPTADADGKIVASVFNAEARCAAKMNRRASRLAKVAGMDDVKCLRDESSTGGDATACVDDQETRRTTVAEKRLLSDFGVFCTIPPAFATNVGTCCDGGANDGETCAEASDCPGGACTAGACISGASEGAASAVAHDLFGSPVSVGAGATGACQWKILHAAASVHEIRWRSLAKCKQQKILNITSEAEFVTTCLGPPQPAYANIERKENALASKIQRACLDRGITPLSTVFPGACAGEGDADYASCLGRRIACRFCLGAVVADDIITPLDCDLLDDGASNGSCP
jgi:hypothetical protein